MPSDECKPHKHRIVLIGAPALLSEGLVALLEQAPDVEVLGWLSAQPGSEVNQLQQWLCCADTQPDALLVIENSAEREKDRVDIAQLILHFPDLPVISISLAQGTFRVYTSQTAPARSASLLETIRKLT